MSFLAKFGARVCNTSIRLLNAGALRLPQQPGCSFHIMAECRALGLNAAVAPALSAATSISAATHRLLTPFTSLLTQVAGFKVKGRLRRRCKDCYFVIRQQRAYVICPTHPRHKQMAMKKRDYKSWILTHATQSKQRPY